MSQFIVIGLMLIVTVTPLPSAHAAPSRTPECRLDRDLTLVVRRAANEVVASYKKLQVTLPFKHIAVNEGAHTDNDTLVIEIVKDARADGVDANGCIVIDALGANKPLLDGNCVPTHLSACTSTERKNMRQHTEADPRFGLAGSCYFTNTQACSSGELDALWSGATRDHFDVDGGCSAVPQSVPATIRCSAGIVKLLLTERAATNEPTAALLFVIAHEIFHVTQGLPSSYASSDTSIDLSLPQSEKTSRLRYQCDLAPTLGANEDQADHAALDVLKVLWPSLQEQLGRDQSRSYHVDQFGYAASYVSQALRFWEAESKIIVHPVLATQTMSTDPDSPPEWLAPAVRTFYCDVLRPGRGSMRLPFYHGDHAALATRMTRVSAELAAPKADSDDPMTAFQTAISALLAQVDGVVDHYEWQREEAFCGLVRASADCSLLESGDADDPKNTILHSAARQRRAALVQQLLDAGNDVNSKNSKGSTPLFFAVQSNDARSVELLLNAGADPNMENAFGLRPLCFNGIEVISSQLPQERIPPTTQSDADHIGELLLTRGADATTQCPIPLIYSAILAGQLNTLGKLLSLGAQPNDRDEDGLTPLSAAVMLRSPRAVEVLLTGGADPNLRDPSGRTALHDAAEIGNENIVNILIRHGAHTELQTNNGLTALDIACESGNKAIARLLHVTDAALSAKCRSVLEDIAP